MIRGLAKLSLILQNIYTKKRKTTQKNAKLENYMKLYKLLKTIRPTFPPETLHQYSPNLALKLQPCWHVGIGVRWLVKNDV